MVGSATDVPLTLYPLTYLDEGDEVTVGRPDIDSYVVLPPDGAALLRRLEAGTPPREAARWYEETYGERVDIEEFVAGLDEIDFIAPAGTVLRVAGEVRWRKLGAALFSPVAWGVYAVLVLAAAVAVARNHALVPHYRQFFFSPYMSVIELVVFTAQIPLLLLHEAFHALAGRRLGLRSRLSIGRRLYFIVFETALDGLVAVERRKRLLPMLAGMLADVLVFAVLTLVGALTWQAGGWAGAIGGAALALAFTTVLRLAWQFFFHLRTDLYYVAVTLLGCVDLQTVARRTLRNRLNRALGRRHALLDEASWHPRDRAVARWYSWLLLAGYSVSIGTLIWAVVPMAFHIFSVVFGRFTGSGNPSVVELADSAGFLAINLAQVIVILALGRKERARTVTYTHVLS